MLLMSISSFSTHNVHYSIKNQEMNFKKGGKNNPLSKDESLEQDS